MTSKLVGSALPRFTKGWHSFAQAHAAAVNAKQLLQQAGVRVPESGRLNKFIQQLALVQTVGPTAAELPKKLVLERLHRALVDTAELSLIAEQFAKQPETAGWRLKAHLAMKGSDKPSEEQSDSHAWDHQFELFIAALFSRAGYEITLAEPDVVIRTHQGLVGIAAKRPHTWTNLDVLIEKANRQIYDTGHIGIIALGC